MSCNAEGVLLGYQPNRYIYHLATRIAIWTVNFREVRGGCITPHVKIRGRTLYVPAVLLHEFVHDGVLFVVRKLGPVLLTSMTMVCASIF